MSQEINSLLDIIVEKNASDLHLHVDKPPTMRVNNQLVEMGKKPLTPEDTVSYMKAIASAEQQAEVEKVGGTDFGYALLCFRRQSKIPGQYLPAKGQY